MIRLCMAGAVLTAVVFCIMLWNWIIIPRSAKDTKRAIKIAKDLEKNTDYNVRRRAATVRALSDVYRELKVFPYGKRYVKDVSRIITALDARVDGKLMTVDHVYVKQCNYAIICVIFGLMFNLAASLVTASFVWFGFLLIPLAPIAYKMPLGNMKERLHTEQVLAMSQFHEFYDLYYCQFSRKENSLMMMDVVSNFIPLANTPLRKILERFNIDLEAGEEAALEKLKDRYPDNNRIHKFVSVALMRMQGDEAAYDVMRSFRAEMAQDIKLARIKDLDNRTKIAGTISNAVVMTLIVCFIVVMCISVLVS